MIQLDPILPTYPNDHVSRHTWERLAALLQAEGHGFYRHPNLSLSSEAQFPDFVILTKTHSVLVVVCLDSRIEDLVSVGGETWQTQNGGLQSPILRLEDLVEGLNQRLNRERRLRGKMPVKAVLALPLVSEHAFRERFQDFDDSGVSIVWQEGETNADFSLAEAIPDDRFKLALSVLQTAHAIGASTASTALVQTSTMGEAIRQLDTAMMLLDAEQQKAALNIPPGPQCIRGLAGTGKTVLLAMKAASIHSHFPDKRILFTFNTQSLYNQIRNLVTRFYRVNHHEDPNWDLIHVRHAWGGARRPGVYSDICKRHGYIPLTLSSARAQDAVHPFRACCNAMLKAEIQPFYDFVLVDEAQDFPPEFFHLLWRLTRGNHCIYYAYDELQSLSSVEMPPPRELFGADERGNPRFDVDGEYPGPMEKVLTLTRSYRCPRNVLMLAHGVGLAIHGPRGPVQMLERAASWRALGYEPADNVFEAGKATIIHRPAENSPNIVENVFHGDRPFISIAIHETRATELEAVAESIRRDINEQSVPPHQIIVISLDSINAKRLMMDLQVRLQRHAIASTIPGLVDDSAEFAEEGFVTLSTVYRAKGNEAPVIYIIAFERLWDYVDEVTFRNRAFTSISRTKGWLSISGSGPQMTQVKTELDKIMVDLPNFRFVYPDMTQIQRRLDPSETTRRRVWVQQAKKSARQIEEIDVEALAASLDSEELRRLEERIKKAREVRGED